MIYFIGNLYVDNKKQLDEKEQKKFVSNWNKKIKATDEVYILGGLLQDVSSENYSIIKKMNGKKYLIASYKDYEILKDEMYKDIFESVSAYKEIQYKKHKICLSVTPFLFNKNIGKSIILYSYSLKNETMGIKDTIFYENSIKDENTKFVDVNWRRLNNYMPISIDELLTYKEIRGKKHEILCDQQTIYKPKNKKIDTKENTTQNNPKETVKNTSKDKSTTQTEKKTKGAETKSIFPIKKDTSAKTLVHNSKTAAPKKRGRKPKETTVAFAEEVPTTKKRGRKPKVETEVVNSDKNKKQSSVSRKKNVSIREKQVADTKKKAPQKSETKTLKTVSKINTSKTKTKEVESTTTSKKRGRPRKQQ